MAYKASPKAVKLWKQISSVGKKRFVLNFVIYFFLFGMFMAFLDLVVKSPIDRHYLYTRIRFVIVSTGLGGILGILWWQIGKVRFNEATPNVLIRLIYGIQPRVVVKKDYGSGIRLYLAVLFKWAIPTAISLPLSDCVIRASRGSVMPDINLLILEFVAALIGGFIIGVYKLRR